VKSGFGFRKCIEFKKKKKKNNKKTPHRQSPPKGPRREWALGEKEKQNNDAQYKNNHGLTPANSSYHEHTD
jgi:hypothetical protein